MKMFVVTHKESSLLPDGREFIGVGKNKNIPNVKIYDNTGENISEKNKYFCELTALYWIWKNCDEDIVSFEHYRRFFGSAKKGNSKNIISKEEIKELMNDYDCLASNKFLVMKVKSHYKFYHYLCDMDLCKKIIKETCPEYIDSFNKVMRSWRMNCYNVMCIKKKYLDEYCEWLFPILFEVEKQIDTSSRSAYQQRVYGFLSERLFNVWLDHKKLKVKHIPIILTQTKGIVIFYIKLFCRTFFLRKK